MNHFLKGFSLIELMVVVAVIGILATVAIPSYRDYTIKSQITEAINHLNTYKTAVEEYYNIHGKMPPEGNIGIGNYSQGSSMTVTSHPTISKQHSYRHSDTDFRLVVVLKTEIFPSNISSTITEPLVTLRTTVNSNGSIEWLCGTSIGENRKIPYKYLPSSCRTEI